MKRIVILIIAAGAAWLLIFSRRQEPSKINETASASRAGTNSPERRIGPGGARTDVPARGAAVTESESDPNLQLWPEAVPAEARHFMIKALRSAQVIENERRAFPKNSPGDKLLDSLQRKLFIDDYTYAALATGKIDSARAAEVFDKLVERLRQQQHVPAQAISEGPARNDSHLAERMAEHYQALLQSQNGGYSNVWRAVSAFSSNALGTDLFKDALVYVALRTEVDDWMNEEIKDRQAVLARQAEYVKNAQLAGTSSLNYEAISQNQVANLMGVQGAYHKVFAFRFADNHALEVRTVLAELDKLKLSGAGPELVVPAR